MKGLINTHSKKWMAGFFGAWGALALTAGCMKPGDGMGLDSKGNLLPPKPTIAYAGPVVDTIGVAANHTPVLTGGPISFSVSPDLVAGLNLSATSGVISGSPLAASPAVNYTVVATGPGGSASAVFSISVVDPCVANPSLPICNSKPEVSYATPVVDTMGRTHSHVPLITGRVTGFALGGTLLPAGLTLNTGSGQISGTPTSLSPAVDITIVATGPGGSDTATLNISVVTDPCVANPNLPGCPLPANYFQANVVPIFTTNCETCHNPTGTCYGQTQLSLRAADAYNALVNVASSSLDVWGYPIEMNRVKPGNSDSSYLFMKISKTKAELTALEYSGDRMPLNVAQPLSATDIDIIKRWIDGGAPRN